MFRKAIVMLAVLVLLGLPFSGVEAQGEGQPPLFCGELSEADCAILAQAQVTMAGISAAAFDVRLDLAVESSEPEIGQIALTLTGNGAMAADVALMAPFQQPAAMADLMSQAPQMLVDFLRTVNGRANLLIELPEELAAEADFPEEGLPLEMVIVGGVVYVNTESMQPAEAEGPAWVGLDLPGMYESMMATAEGEAQGEMIEEMQGLFETEAFQALVDMQNYADFVHITRLEDAEVGGQQAAVFQSVVDYEAMFTSEIFQQAFMEYMAAIAEMQGEMPEDMPADLMDMMAAFMAGMSVQSTTWVGLEDYRAYHSEMAFGFELNREALLEFEPEAAEDMPEDFSVSLVISLDLSDFDVPVKVTAPEGAQIVNPMMFMETMPEGSD